MNENIRTILLTGCRYPENLPERICFQTKTKPTLRPFLPGKRILAAVCLSIALCITAAAAGLLWQKPDVQDGVPGELRPEETAGFGHTVWLGTGIVSLPEEALQVIRDNRIPERNNNSFLYFDTVKEWQTLFGLPFVSSSLLDIQEDDGMDVFVTAAETDGEIQPMTMIAVLGTYFTDEDGFEEPYTLELHAALCEEAAETGSFSYIYTDGVAGETTEYITSAGVPCIIYKTYETSNNKELLHFTLYYNYESVTYSLRSTGIRLEEETAAIARLQQFADTLTITYPTE